MSYSERKAPGGFADRPGTRDEATEGILPHGAPALTFLQRRAAAEFRRCVEAADVGEWFLDKAVGEFWPEVGRLWIRSTQTEKTLTLVAQALRRAADAARDSAEAIGEQRKENELSNLAERCIEREERRPSSG